MLGPLAFALLLLPAVPPAAQGEDARDDPNGVAIHAEADALAEVQALVDAVVDVQQRRTEGHFSHYLDVPGLLDRVEGLLGEELDEEQREAIREYLVRLLSNELVGLLRDSTDASVRRVWNTPDGRRAVVRLREVSMLSTVDEHVELLLSGVGGEARIRDWRHLSDALEVSEWIARWGSTGEGRRQGEVAALGIEEGLWGGVERSWYSRLERLRELEGAFEDEIPALEHYRAQVHAEVALRCLDYGDAERAIAVCAAYRSDDWLVHRFRAELASGRGDHEAAVEQYRTYDERLGGSADAHVRIGNEFLAAGETGSALAAWRDALDLSPTNHDALLALGSTLEGDDLDAFVKELPPGSRDGVSYYRLLAAWALDGRCDTVRKVSAKLLEDSPGWVLGYEYAAECAIEEHRMEEALELARAALDSAPENDLWVYEELYAGVASRQADPVAAYRTAPEPASLFSAIAWELARNREDAAGLQRLIEARREDAPDDPWIDYYQGELHWLRGELEAAAERFAACAQVPEDGDEDAEWPETIWEAQSALVAVRYEQGRALEVYEEQPNEDLYGELLYSALGDRDIELVEALLDLRAEQEPQDPELDYWRGLLAYWRERDLEALDALRAGAVKWSGVDGAVTWIDVDLVRGHLRAGRTERARELARVATDWRGSPELELYVHVVAREGDAAIAVMQELREDGRDAQRFYDDPLLGGVLRTDGRLARFRALFPE